VAAQNAFTRNMGVSRRPLRDLIDGDDDIVVGRQMDGARAGYDNALWF
jgi:hypothetical protein